LLELPQSESAAGLRPLRPLLCRYKLASRLPLCRRCAAACGEKKRGKTSSPGWVWPPRRAQGAGAPAGEPHSRSAAAASR